MRRFLKQRSSGQLAIFPYKHLSGRQLTLFSSIENIVTNEVISPLAKMFSKVVSQMLLQFRKAKPTYASLINAPISTTTFSPGN